MQLLSTAFTQKMKDNIPMLEKLKEENPDLGDAIDAKIATCKVRSGSKFDLQNIQAALNDLYTLMDEVDSQLKTSRACTYTAIVLASWVLSCVRVVYFIK